MSYYYHNYLICNKQAKNKITSYYNDDYFDDLSGYYQDSIVKINDNTFLVMFDTRGDECSSFIIKFIDAYRNTTWYTIDEELVYQKRYYWNGNSVCVESREIYVPDDKNQIRIEYSDDEERRPLLIYTVTRNKIVVEDILNYKIIEYNLQEEQSKLIDECLCSSTKDASVLNFDQYVVPNIKRIELMIFIHYNGCSIDINSLDKNEKKKKHKYKDGRQKYLEILNTIDTIISNEQDGILIPPSSNVLGTIIKRFVGTRNS